MPTNFQLWGEFRNLAMEVGEIGGALLRGNVSTPALAGAPAHGCASGLVDAPAGLTARAFDTPEETVILLANANSASASFALSSASLPPSATMEVLFENRVLELSSGGELRDTVDGMGTRAYRLSKAPPPPPPAAPPLLINGGFELASSVGVPDGVYAVPYGDLGASFLVDSRLAAAGRHSLRVTTPVAGKGLVLLFCTHDRLATASALGASLMIRHAAGPTKRVRFGLQARPRPSCRTPDPRRRARHRTWRRACNLLLV